MKCIKEPKQTYRRGNSFISFMGIIQCCLCKKHYPDKLNRHHLSRLMRKPTICIYKTKGADQLRRKCEADQRLFSLHGDNNSSTF